MAWAQGRRIRRRLLLARLYLQVAAVIERKILEEQDREQSEPGQTRDSTAAQPGLESRSDSRVLREKKFFAPKNRKVGRIVAVLRAREITTVSDAAYFSSMGRLGSAWRAVYKD